MIIMNSLNITFCICSLAFFILGINGDKNPTGQPLGPFGYNYPQYLKYPQSYYKKPASYYRKCVTAPKAPDGSSLDVITVEGRNGGRPFHNCLYQISSFSGLFFKTNNVYFPCLTPEVLDVVKAGEPLPKSLQVVTGFRETIATKFPLPIPNAVGGRPTSVPVTGAFVTEGFAFLKNTTVPYEWQKDENFYNARQAKIALLKKNAKEYRQTQLELILSLHGALSATVENAELNNFNFNENRNQNEKMDSSPFIVVDSQIFSTPTTRPIQDLLHDDFIQAENTFGLAGTRLEFQDPKIVTERIFKLINREDGERIDVQDLGSSPQEASANVMNLHTAFIDLSRRTQHDLVTTLHDQAGEIQRNSSFSFKVPSLHLGYCNEDIEIDPRGSETIGSINNGMGMGMVSSKPPT